MIPVDSMVILTYTKRPTLDFSPTANFDIILPSLRHNQSIVRNLLNEP